MTFRPYISSGLIINWGAAAALGGFFVVSGCLKVMDFGRFVEAVEGFQILPEWMSIPAAILIAGFEIVGGVFLLLRWKVKEAALGLSGLMIIFAVAIAVNLVREHIVPCGCFGSILDGKISVLYLFRNFCILFLLLWCSRTTKRHSPGL
jgi:uncharacterized membrane protein YphA (DoxX/SURF4 family)